jgi:hypothetical protein
MMREAGMATDEHASKLPWEAPCATALTDTESRADRSDVWMQNGVGGVS